MPDRAVNVHICKEATGEVRIYRDALIVDEFGYHRDYMWREGNYACDCNRALFFARAGGEEDDEVKCGHTQYRVKITDAETGELLYQEFVPEVSNA